MNFNIIKYFWKTIIFTIFVIVLSNISGNSVDKIGFQIPHLDKVVHAAMYFILSFLLILEIKKYRNFKYLKIAIFVLFYCLSIGFLMEFSQKFFASHRSFDIFDELFNVIGCLIGILSFNFIVNILRKFKIFAKYLLNLNF